MSISRREFLRGISSASLVVLGGGVIKLSAADVVAFRKKTALRFVVASDGHFGQPETNFNDLHEKLVSHVTQFHGSNPLDFCVINGDIIHDQKSFLTVAKGYLDKLPVRYFVTKGNHDLVSDEYWQEVWNMPTNHTVKMNRNVVVLGNTSDEKGEYLSPDLGWLKQQLDENSKAKNIFIFLHIPQAKWNKGGIETPAFFELLKAYKNVRGVFHGHEHDQDGVKMRDSIPYMWDSHIAGNWGTSYNGFRVVELTRENDILTYIMNPVEKINQASF
ncbi:MAG TPA: metallophosphoesterase [Chryseolinea sp.]|nr:metallophosphoesterase [Chryseolinea sp.]